MATFYSGKGGASSSSFSSSATKVYGSGSSSYTPSSSYGGTTRGGGQSYASSLFQITPPRAPMASSSLFSKPEYPRAGTPAAGGSWATGGLPARYDSMGNYKPPTTLVGDPILSSSGKYYMKMQNPDGSFAGYMSQGGQVVSGFSRPSTGKVSGGGGGGGMYIPPTPGIEFSLGPAPEMKPLEIDYSKFKDVLLQTQLDPSKVKELSTQYNMTGDEFQKLVASFNPTSAQIADSISLINDPSRLNAIAEGLNRPYREAFERAMPMYEENMGLANALANQYLRGQISSDVESAVMRNAATQRMQSGLFGQGGLGRNIVPRDLGLTSLDLQARGANLLAQTGQLATQVLQSIMPVSGREFAVSPTTIYESMRVSPTALLNATYIPASEIFRAYTVPASQVFDTYVSQAQYNQQIANQNLLNAWQGKTFPGQYVPGKGYLNFDGVTYSQTRPPLPGTEGTKRPITNWQGIRV